LAFPWGPAPSLGEFIEKARAYGAEVRHSPHVLEGPGGPVRFSYLWIDSERFAPLPDLSNDGILAPDMVDYLARRLKVPTSEFWPGFTGFPDPDDEPPPAPDEE
jgi:hypothetical protein